MIIRRDNIIYRCLSCSTTSSTDPYLQDGVLYCTNCTIKKRMLLAGLKDKKLRAEEMEHRKEVQNKISLNYEKRKIIKRKKDLNLFLKSKKTAANDKKIIRMNADILSCENKIKKLSQDIIK